MDELDELDRCILVQLDNNSRQTVAELGRNLKLSRDRVLYRLKKLQTLGLLRGFTAAVNTHKLGLYIYKTYLRLNRNEEGFEKFLAHLQAHPLVTWIGETEGKWDILFSIYARDPAEFFGIQRETLLEFSQLINYFSVYTLVDAHCYRKSFLTGQTSESFYFGGTPGHFAADEIDVSIMKLLSEDSRLSKAEIGARLGLSPMAVKYRIDKLEEHEVIVSYPVDLDLAKLGMLFFKLQLQFASYDQKSEEELLGYCQENPHIMLFIRQIGDCMVELEAEVESYQHLNEIIGELRSRFPGFIREIDTIFIKKQQFKWVPFHLEHIEPDPARQAV